MESRPDAVSECDLLLTGGRVIDPETGLDEVLDVAVTAGAIVAVGGSGLRAARTLDVSGRVVTAGFIDLHSHAQNIPSLRLQALDGVTTALELESGAGDVSRSLDQAATEGRPVNYGYSASWAQARMDVLDGWSPAGGFLDFTTGIAAKGWQRPANGDELAKILDRLEDQLAAGALGIGVLVGYAPQTGRNEYLQVASLAARHDVPTFTHARFKNPEEPESALEGVAEVVAAAAGSGAHMHLCHVNSTSLRAIDEVAELIDGSRARGLKISTEAYPYGAGMTAIGVPFLHPDNLARLGIQPSNLRVVATGEQPRDAARLLQLRRETPGALVIIHYLDEAQESDLSHIHRALLMADTAVASDAIPFTTPAGLVVEGNQPMPGDAVSHPRTIGTFSRFLRTMVRETGALSLAQALRRCSLLPAQILQQASPSMARKGRVQVGADADLVVFDPDLVSDRSTYEDPQASSIGFEHVLVAGEPVVLDGTVITSALPGRPVVRGSPMTTEGKLVGLDDIRAAADRISDVVLRTPVIDLPHPDRPGDLLRCKAESLQPTGAFKLRGAYNTIAQVIDQARANGIVAQSSGNHARAVAWLARRLDLYAVIVMPDAAPANKVAAVRALGAEVELVPAAERDIRPLELAAKGFVHVPPYDDPRIIAGQGTVGLELLEQVPDVETVLVPVSGGGLISGIATAVKILRPGVRVVGVEPALAADAAESLFTGRRITWDPERTYRTVADGLRTTALGVHPWEHVRRYVDEIVTVTDEQILAAMRHLAIEGRLVAEPAGAAAVAAWMHEVLPSGRRTAAIVSGGSVDPALLASVLGEVR